MQGNIDFTGVDFVTPDLDLDKAHIVKLYSLTGVNKHVTSHPHLFRTKHVEEQTQVESASHLLAKDIDIHTDALKIRASNIAAKKVHIQAYSLDASASILKSTQKTSFVGLRFHTNLPTFEQSTVYTLIQPLDKNAHTADIVADFVNRTTQVSNLAGGLLKAQHQKSNLGVLQALTGFNPSLSISLTKENTYYEQEHKGEGALLAQDLSLDVHTIRLDNDYGMQVSHQAEINTDNLTATAAKLNTV